MIAGQEKFDGLKFLEELLEAAIIEILHGTRLPARSERHDLLFDNTIGEQRRRSRLLIGLKKSEQIRARPKYFKQALDGCVEQRRREKLQRVPQQRAVETLAGKFQALGQELTHPLGILLIHDEVAVHSERLVERAQDVIGVDTMPQGRDKANISLAGPGEVEDGQIRLPIYRRKELLQPVTGPVLRLHVGIRVLSVRIDRWRGRFGSPPVF